MAWLLCNRAEVPQRATSQCAVAHACQSQLPKKLRQFRETSLQNKKNWGCGSAPLGSIRSTERLGGGGGGDSANIHPNRTKSKISKRHVPHSKFTQHDLQPLSQVVHHWGMEKQIAPNPAVDTAWGRKGFWRRPHLGGPGGCYEQ